MVLCIHYVCSYLYVSHAAVLPFVIVLHVSCFPLFSVPSQGFTRVVVMDEWTIDTLSF